MKDKKDILNQAVEHLAKAKVSYAPPQEVADATVARLTEMSGSYEQPNIWRMVAKNRIGQIAAAIIVVSAICLVILSDKDELERYEATGPGVATKTEMPAKPLSLISLNIAYRKGGMEAVEKQYEKAFNRTGPRPVKLTVEDLFMELNGG